MSPIQIIVRSISESPAIEQHINKYFSKINRVHHKIKHCRIVIDTTQNHKHKGKIFSACIDVALPGKELVSKKQNQNLYVAIRDGFAAIEKLLKKHAKKRYIITKNRLQAESPKAINERGSLTTECA